MSDQWLSVTLKSAKLDMSATPPPLTRKVYELESFPLVFSPLTSVMWWYFTLADLPVPHCGSDAAVLPEKTAASFSISPAADAAGRRVNCFLSPKPSTDRSFFLRCSLVNHDFPFCGMRCMPTHASGRSREYVNAMQGEGVGEGGGGCAVSGWRVVSQRASVVRVDAECWRHVVLVHQKAEAEEALVHEHVRVLGQLALVPMGMK